MVKVLHLSVLLYKIKVSTFFGQAEGGDATIALRATVPGENINKKVLVIWLDLEFLQFS